MRIIVLLLFAVLAFQSKVSSQDKDSSARPFSEWHFRVNPFSLVEVMGGIHVGVETNLDKRRKFYLVSEYGYIFLNNRGSAEGQNDTKDKSRISGFETKQEMRIMTPNRKARASFFAAEVHYLRADVKNSGWFGMETPDASGSYPYMKYQDFTESISSTSVAIKYGTKLYAQEARFNLEGFIGFGFQHQNINKFRNAEGVLLESDKETFFNRSGIRILPYIPAGLRLTFRLR
jgi:hypothetical protein